MSKLKQISTYTILALFVLSIVAPLVTIPIKMQVTGAVQIISIDPTIVYPGETVRVRMAVFFGGITVTVRLTNATTGQKAVWAERALHALAPGEYEVLVPLPLRLPGARDSEPNGLVDLVVEVYAIGQRQDYEVVSVGPRIVVTPSVSTVVDPFGRPNTITVSFYGFVPDSTVNSLIFRNKAYPAIAFNYSITVVTIGRDASGSTTVPLYDAERFPGLPKGEYDVTCTVTGTNSERIMPGSLRIEPQVVISPTESHGRCDTRICQSDDLIIRGYGFDANLSIVELKLMNINFTNVQYRVPVTARSTDGRGNFEVNTTQLRFRTNMTAGLYIPEVRLAPAPRNFVNTSTVPLKQRGWVAITPGATRPELGVSVLINAPFYIDGFLGYIPRTVNESFVLTEVLKINIPIRAKRYQLAANRLNDGTVVFALYNITGVPPVLLATVEVPLGSQTYNATIGAWVANASFNIAVGQMVSRAPQYDGEYAYWATFYTYVNKIVLLLREYGLSVSAANLTIVYRRDTVVRSYYYVYPHNITVSGLTIAVTKPVELTDAGIEWKISWEYDAGPRQAKLTATARPTVGPIYRFTNVYHIVRPFLVIVHPVGQIIRPGDTITIAAYGYGPGKYWGYPTNVLTVYWEKAQKLTEVELVKDGNATFIVTIPKDATFGVHYIWGVDSWGYEYSLAVIIGARAYWEKVVDDPRLIIDPTKPDVSAGYNNERFVVCPCPESLNVVAVKYCGVCVVYAARCDYLGDKIRVTLSGLYPGERIEVYFAGIRVRTVRANSSVESIEFVVPTLRSGTYDIYAVGSVSGYISVDMFHNTTHFIQAKPRVVPKILVLDLQRNHVPILVGPGLVRVIGTGFEPGVAIEAVLFNETDAMVKFNEHVTKWYSDDKGVLSSPYTKVLGIYVPALDPGAYEVKLVYLLGGAQRAHSMPSYVFVINNLSIVATKPDIESLRRALMSRLDDVESAVRIARDAAVRAEGAVSDLRRWLEKSLGDLSKDVSDLKAAVATKADVADISKKLDEVISAVRAVSTAIADRIEKSLADLKAAVATKADVADISRKLDTLASDIDNAILRLEDLSKAMTTLQQIIPVEAIREASMNVRTALDALQKARDEITSMRADINGLRSDVSSLRSDVDRIKPNVEKVAGIESAVKSIEDSVSGIRTLVIIALVFAVIAAAASIYAIVSISRALAK